MYLRDFNGSPAKRRPQPHLASRSGQALVELAILAPFIFFLFIGVIDIGCYTVTAIGVQSAARAAAAAGACTAIGQELQSLPNYAISTATCSASAPAPGADTVATVTYQTSPLIPIPFFSSGLTIAGSAVMPPPVN
jgi:Flp pilus assembly protein TadG